MTTAETPKPTLTQQLAVELAAKLTEESDEGLPYEPEYLLESVEEGSFSDAEAVAIWETLLSTFEKLEQATRILIESVNAIGGQAVEGASLEFLANLPTEIKGKLERLQAELSAMRERERWIPISDKPQRAGWYNVCRITDGHRSVRCWDDSTEAWMYPGAGPHGTIFVPNNAFTHYCELPTPLVKHVQEQSR